MRSPPGTRQQDELAYSSGKFGEFQGLAFAKRRRGPRQNAAGEAPEKSWIKDREYADKAQELCAAGYSTACLAIHAAGIVG